MVSEKELAMNTILLLLGSNLGDSQQLLAHATEKLAKNVGKIVKQSTIYKTAPWGYEGNNYYLNQVLQIESSLSPLALLNENREIEKGLGRIRNNNYQWEDRTLDIDILFYNDEIIESNNLIVPHPRLHLRKFTLIPLAEIVAEFIHPIIGQPVKQLLENCNDDGLVEVFGHFEE